jgi:hypothetical protein
MTDVDLNFLARQNQRSRHDLAGVRDELRVQGAMIMEPEGAVASLSEQVQLYTTKSVALTIDLRELEDAGS